MFGAVGEMRRCDNYRSTVIGNESRKSNSTRGYKKQKNTSEIRSRIPERFSMGTPGIVVGHRDDSRRLR